MGQKKRKLFPRLVVKNSQNDVFAQKIYLEYATKRAACLSLKTKIGTIETDICLYLFFISRILGRI